MKKYLNEKLDLLNDEDTLFSNKNNNNNNQSIDIEIKWVDLYL